MVCNAKGYIVKNRYNHSEQRSRSERTLYRGHKYKKNTHTQVTSTDILAARYLFCTCNRYTADRLEVATPQYNHSSTHHQALLESNRLSGQKPFDYKTTASASSILCLIHSHPTIHDGYKFTKVHDMFISHKEENNLFSGNL